MIKFIKDVFRESIVTLLSTAISTSLTVFGVKYFEKTYEINIDSKYVISVIVIIVILAISNLCRLIHKRKIDNIQEPDQMFFSTIIPDGVLTIKNNLEMYKINVQINNNRHHNQFENIEPAYSVIDVDGPFCPECELDLKEKRTFFGLYKHYCSREHVTFKSKYSSNSMREHKKTDYNKELRDNGIKNLSD
ncbi:hypothetical protein [Vagococcus hydrophili]|uniref:Uncharacterized protein n=1 Tax=Vagococcus hydrophili TaxID=2714947 RepID=A0A6G8APW7_9ENTE|nr:hypothetical protein [Vagococcus hydrophili]QIL47046.1 hypothetical protein G7082_00130 [Vagococcus hydrophili]